MMNNNALPRAAFYFLLMAITAILAYSNTFNVPFQFDDNPVIVDNPIVKDLRYFIEPSDAARFRGHFEYASFKRRYIGYLTFALNYRIHGLDVTGYHIANLLIHILNAVILFFLVMFTFNTPFLRRSSIKEHAWKIAVVAAMLFVSHPIQTQAVTYIWQRVTSLTATFYLFSLLMYIKARNDTSDAGVLSRKNLLPYILSIISAVLAMKTKEIAITLPVMVGLYEFMFLEGKVRRRILYLIPLLCTLFIIPLSLMGTDSSIVDVIDNIGKPLDKAEAISQGDYLFTQFRVLVTYIRLIFIPVNQNLDYDYPLYSSLFEPVVFLSFVFLLFIFGLGMYLFYRYRGSVPHTRVMSFGIFWFFITLSVESSIMPIKDVIFEHRMYLPSVGVFMLLVTSAYMCVEGVKQKWKNVEKVTVLVLAVVIVVLAGAAYSRNGVWRDGVSLWTDVVSKSPGKARPHNNLGQALEEKGMADQAMEQYNKALNLIDDFAGSDFLAGVHLNLGNVLNRKGMTEEAIEEYKRALRLYPAYPEAHNNLGSAYKSRGLLDKAVKHFKTAIRLDPDSVNAYNNLGTALNETGRTDEAIKQYKNALALNPDFAEAHLNIGNAYKDKGDLINAEKSWKRTLEIKPLHSLALNQLGNVYYYRGMFQDAKKYYSASLEVDNMHAKSHYNLALTLEKLNDTSGAIRHYELFIKTATSEHHNLIPEVRKRISMLSVRP
jgi:tetratricopeptide (TPR) repeat protein